MEDKHRFEFLITGYADPPYLLEDHFNNIGGRALMHVVRKSLVARGYTCDEVDQEDYGWSVLAEKPNESYHIALGVWSDVNDDLTSTSEGWLDVSVWDTRGLIQRWFKKREMPSIRDTDGATELRSVLEETGGIQTMKEIYMNND